ncbi:MAG: protein translocase subunit SecD [Alphaproteobacteria bacterium]|jgi:preprotein translocase subunit SecD|nr:protein translocase subunit SecD [Alphaproteobacteria bacterium]
MLHIQTWKVIAATLLCLVGIVFAAPNLLAPEQITHLPKWLPHQRVNLGLDLQGGAYLLLEVDTKAVARERLNNVVETARNSFRAARIGYTRLSPSGDRAVVVKLREAGQLQQALDLLKKELEPAGSGIMVLGQQKPELSFASTPDGEITVTLTEEAIVDKSRKAVEQSIEIVRRRIDETGVSEPQIARQGQDRILIQLPGVQDPERIKRLLGQTAKMSFRMVDTSANPNDRTPPPGSDFLEVEGEKGPNGQLNRIAVRKKVEVAGENLVDAQASSDTRNGQWVVNFKFDSVGARRFGDVTRENVGKPFAIVLDDKVISYPVIREPILGGSGQISGSYTAASANDLAVLLRAGALPAPLTIIEERTVGPDLGADSIKAGIFATLIGFVLVVTYMSIFYGRFGFYANVALVMNLVLSLGALSLLQATLTLPGIAGLLLSMGLSVDANVLINERIREETKLGKSPVAALDAGFKRAFSTIVDANFTTVIKMIILFALGSGPVKGFAVTTSIAIMISMFTATLLVRILMADWLRSTRPKSIPV